MFHARRIVVLGSLGMVMSVATAVPAQAVTANAPQPSATVAAPMAGEQFRVTGALTDPAGTRTMFLQVKDSSADWHNLYTQSSETGAYNFLVRITKPTYFRVASPATPPETPGDEAGTIYTSSLYVPVAAQGVAAWITRGCGSDNRCGGTAFASGYVRPVRDNRLVVLQILNGSSWKKVTQGRTDAAGNFRMPFSISGWSQWTARRFRVIAGGYAQSATAVSTGISFMPGPTVIGHDVLRVDVDGGASPATKGRDYSGFATLSRDNSVLINRAKLDKFGVRGSTTSGYPKKPYNLRFVAPPAVPVFGMPPDRSWTLLAMWADQSFVRDKSALDLGRRLAATGHGMTWNPDSEYVEMFVNSEYKGAYLMTEKVQIDGDKVNVDKDTGMIMETDMDVVKDPRKGFRASRSGTIFAFKDPDGYGGSQGITSEKLSRIKSKIAAVESYLYTSNRTGYRTHIDRDSAADFHLGVEFFKDIDADFWRSKYFAWDMVNGACGNELCDGRLHFGPLWDFDKSAGNVDPTNPGTTFTRSYRGWAANGTGVGKANRVTYDTHWFVQLWKVPAFRGYLVYRWKQARPIFYQTWSQEVARNKALIGVGAYNDRQRWARYPKNYAPKGPTYSHEVQYVATWLKNRYSWMNSQLG
jgi:hypothetical protein